MSDPDFFPSSQRVGIWGAGLLGGAIGLGLKARGHEGEIIAIGRNPDKLKRALELQACDRTTVNPEEVLSGLDLLVLAVPVDLIAPLLASVKNDLPAGLLITDVGSTKARVVREVGDALAGCSAVFVGSHPMAGSERSGIEASSADLYQGATVVVTPLPETPVEYIQKIRAFWLKLGSRVIETTPEKHDRMTAITSHIPHMAATLLCQLYDMRGGSDSLYREVVASGFLDTTRVAAGDAIMWRDILVHNRHEIAQGLDQLRSLLSELIDNLETEDSEKLVQLLSSAAVVRKGLGNGK
jgi:prephenate dehydrogenase